MPRLNDHDGSHRARFLTTRPIPLAAGPPGSQLPLLLFPAGLLDVDGAVDVEGLDVEATGDVRGGGVVDAAGDPQLAHALAQVVDDGKSQGALRAAVDLCFILCGRAEHGLVATSVIGAHSRDDFIVVNTRTFSNSIELTDGVAEDVGKGFDLLQLDRLGGLRTDRGLGIGPAERVGQGDPLDEEGQERHAGDDEDDEIALDVGGSAERGQDGQRHRQ